MNIYRVTYKRSSDQIKVDVLAKDAEQAVSHTNRHTKRKHGYVCDVIGLEKILNVDVMYKS